MKSRLARNRRRRGGYTLIEMIVVVGAVTIVLSLCGLLLHGLLRLDKAGRGQFDDATTIGRLSRQFREDVHDASSAERFVEKDKAIGIKLLRDKLTVTYLSDGIKLIRLETLPDGTPRNREGYRVDRLGPVDFEVKKPMVQLSLSRTPNTAGNLPHPPIRIDAELGKTRRLGQLPENTP